MTSNKKELLLEMKNIHINGFSDELEMDFIKDVLREGWSYIGMMG